MQDEAAMALQALKAAASSESEDNEAPAPEETRLPEPGASMQTIHKAAERIMGRRLNPKLKCIRIPPARRRGELLNVVVRKWGIVMRNYPTPERTLVFSSADETPKTHKK